MRALWLALVVLVAGCSGARDASDDVTVDGGVLCGVVVDQRVVPVEGASIRTLDGRNATSDENGAFCLHGLPPGDVFLTVSKPGYSSSQASARVPETGTAPVVSVMIEQQLGRQPAMEMVKFTGFYECAFAAPFITDSCDFGVRTVSDAINDTAGVRLPRGVGTNTNTMFMAVPGSVDSIVQEAVWDNPEVPEMMVMVSSTPIDNACDCSDNDYVLVTGPSPTYGRADEERVPRGELVAVRGFLPFGDATVALNHEFEVFTTFFHFIVPPEGWSHVAGDPVPF